MWRVDFFFFYLFFISYRFKSINIYQSSSRDRSSTDLLLGISIVSNCVKCSALLTDAMIVIYTTHIYHTGITQKPTITILFVNYKKEKEKRDILSKTVSSFIFCLFFVFFYCICPKFGLRRNNDRHRNLYIYILQSLFHALKTIMKRGCVLKRKIKNTQPKHSIFVH